MVAPIDGRLLTVHPHAYVVINDARLAVLVHLGIDTVSRRGQGFTVLREEGEVVTAGEPILAWDPAEVRAAGLATMVPVVALEKTEETIVDITRGDVATGQRFFRYSR